MKEVAAILKVRTATVYKIIDRSELPHTRVVSACKADCERHHAAGHRPDLGDAQGATMVLMGVRTASAGLQ